MEGKAKNDVRPVSVLAREGALSHNELIVYEFGRLLINEFGSYKSQISITDIKNKLLDLLKNPKAIELFLFMMIMAFRKIPVRPK
jgi:hypothetical protein